MKLDRRLLRHTGSLAGYLAAMIGLALLAGLGTLAQAHALSGIIARVFVGGQDLAGVGVLLALLGGAVALRALVSGVIEGLAGWAAGRAKANLRDPLIAHLFALGPVGLRAEHTGGLSALATDGIESLDAYFSQYLPQLFLVGIIPPGVLLAVAVTDPLSGLVLGLTAPLLPIFMNLIGKLAEARTAQQWRTMQRMSAHFLDVLQGLPTLKLLGRSARQAETIARISAQFRDTTLGVLRVAFLSALVLELGATLSTAIIAVEVGLRVLYAQMEFGPALFVLLLAPEFYAPFRALGARFHAAMNGSAASSQALDLLERPVHTPTPLANPDLTPMVAHSPIVFDQVSYTYPIADGEGERAAALHNISLTIQPGSRVALVGESGAGKSTVAALLLRLLEPTSGIIRVGGAPLHELAADTWRQQIAWVPQRPYLFHASVADNIRLGRPHLPLAAVIQAAETAHAAEFIATLPQGYDTIIGERGNRLSGGQAQRLALARAFIQDAPILILDEATAHLDPEHERLVRTALARLMQGRTVLLIAHRLDTIAAADQILVLDHGHLVESGPGATLLCQDGIYRNLVAAYGGLP